MRLAVIIPSYNHAHFLSAALDSILAQTRPPHRIIVVDDGSQDDSPALIRSYANRGVEGHARENRGAHHTLNELVARAATDCDLISILNSDDLYDPNRFALCLPLLEANPLCQIATSALHIIDQNSAPLPPDHPRAKWFRAAWSLHHPDRDLAEWLGIANFPATTSNLIARSSWLQRFPFRPYRFNHDYYLLAQTVLRGALAVHPDPLVHYRVHGSNTMNSLPAPLLREMLRMSLDLAHDLAPELAADPTLRARYATYTRAQWDSISSFPSGLYQSLVASAAAHLSESEIARAVDALQPLSHPELATYPNRSLVNHWDGHSPVNQARGLTEKFESLRLSHQDHQARARGFKELAALRGRLANSRWLALGRTLGLWSPPSLPSSPPHQQAAALAAALAQQPWVRLGQRCRALPSPS